MGLSSEDLGSIFSNVETIAHFHRVTVMDFEEDSSPEKVAQAFARNAPYLKLYTAYVSSYDRCMHTVNRLSSNKHWQRFVEEQRNNKVVCAHNSRACQRSHQAFSFVTGSPGFGFAFISDHARAAVPH